MKEELSVLQLQLLDFDNDRRQLWQQKRYPYAAHIELTPKCNMNCIHCYLKKQHGMKELSHERIIEILDILHEKKVLFLTFTGGEILTRNDFVDIYLYAKKKGFLVELFSNGYLFTDEIIAVLKKYPPLVIDISLYGGTEETYRRVTGVKGALAKVAANCEKLVDAGLRVTLKSPIINETFNEIDMMKKLAERLNVPISISFEICPTVEGDTEVCDHQLSDAQILRYEFAQYVSEKGEPDDLIHRGDRLFACKVGRNSFVVDYNGKMCPCMKMRHRAVSFTQSTFDEAWNSFREYGEMKLSKASQCNGCELEPYCEICPAEMDFLFGDYGHVAERYCRLARARKMFYGDHLPATEVIKQL